jgi:hypothetical protein
MYLWSMELETVIRSGCRVNVGHRMDLGCVSGHCYVEMTVEGQTGVTFN